MSRRDPLQPPAAAASSGHLTGGNFSLLPTEVIQTYILPRLDGPTLASAACASSLLRGLCSSDALWQDLSTATWPSTADPAVSRLISTFDSGFRSFYADAYPVPLRPLTKSSLTDLTSSSISTPLCGPTENPTAKLVSAVDVFYRDDLLFSKVEETETSGEPFLSAPFQISLKTRIMIPISRLTTEALMKPLEDNLRVSWVIIDPARKRALSLPGPRLVKVEPCWIGGLIWARFSSVIGPGRGESNLTALNVVVPCVWWEHSFEVTKIKATMEDADGDEESGKGGLVILVAAMEGGRRRRPEGIVAVKERLEEFEEMKRRRRRRWWRERLDGGVRPAGFLCAAITIYLILFSYIGLVVYWHISLNVS